jgi:lipopolysaccharide biosynthesis protein
MSRVDVVCFYLPQFYRTKENNQWWGEGFTEWTNVAKSRPVFEGHHQPQLPGQLGFYDTTNPSTLVEQVNLAKEYGVDAFCFYHYWFSGKRVLEKPVDLFSAGEIDFPFFLCWANENWTKNWDGGNREILLEQKYEEGFEASFFSDALNYFQAPNYKKINNSPVLLIYRPEDLPNPRKSLALLRELAVQAGFNGLYISAVSSFGTFDPRDVGADAIVEFPPLGTHAAAAIPRPKTASKEFAGHFYDYGLAAKYSCEMRPESFRIHRGVMPGWDNTPRRQKDSTIFLGSTPELFEAWLAHQIIWTQERRALEPHQPAMVFINAWNEWAEGAHLEPDTVNGKSFLEKIHTARAFGVRMSSSEARLKIEKLIDASAVVRSDESVLARMISGMATFTQGQALPILREIRFRNLMRLVDLLRADASGAELIRGLKDAIRNLRGVGYRWQARTYVQEQKIHLDRVESNHVFTAHIFYEDYVERVKSIAQTTSKFTKFLITSPNPGIVEELQGFFKSIGFPSDVRLTPNRGRNFGPLLVEFADEIRQFDFITHLHSKKSPHTVKTKAREWSNRSWRLLAEKDSLVARLHRILESDPTIGIAYDLVTDIVPYTSFAWHSNRALASAYLTTETKALSAQRFPFPAGGMFCARVSSIEGLLIQPHQYEDFPDELGQMDGTQHHMFERLIGIVPLASGSRHLIYDSTRDLFTTDHGYVWGPQ